LIYSRKDRPTWFLIGGVTEDGRYLVLMMAEGATNNNRLYYADLGDSKRPEIGAVIKPLVEDDDAEFSVFGNVGSVLYMRTDKDSPNRKLVAVDLAHPAQADWKTIVPEGKLAIENVALVGGRVVAQYLADVQSRLSLFGLDGSAQGDVPLPGAGSVTRIGGRQDSPEIFYSFSSPLFPTTVFAYDPRSL
jgi:prolyl oligopeptidase